jgi:hypothetical protein
VEWRHGPLQARLGPAGSKGPAGIHGPPEPVKDDSARAANRRRRPRRFKKDDAADRIEGGRGGVMGGRERGVNEHVSWS